MDSFENSRIGKRPNDQKRPGDSESPADPNAGAQSIDEARREKIEKLKKAVGDGTYNVTNERVADKLIEHMLEPKE